MENQAHITRGKHKWIFCIKTKDKFNKQHLIELKRKNEWKEKMVYRLTVTGMFMIYIK